MKIKLFILLVLVALLGVSVITYAGWTRYDMNDGQTPKGACLEMICENGCVENDEKEGYCCPVPEEGISCASDKYDERGCKIYAKKECSSNEICNTKGECQVCSEPTKTSCSIAKDTVNAKGCVTVKKVDCDSEKGEVCNKSNGVCQVCPEPTKTSCSIAKDTVDAKGCVTVKKIDCAEGTPICTKSGKCVACEMNYDCSGRQYCDSQKHECISCPSSKNLPKAGKACTDTCGCADGLECVQTSQSLCGFTGICQNVCESNRDCKKNEYCAFENYAGQCEKGFGQCKSNNILGKSFSSKDFGTFYSSGEEMTWWSAENWCASHGWTLTGVYPSLHCYDGYSSLSLSDNDAAHCCVYGTEDCWDMDKESHKKKISDNMKKLRKSLGKYGCYWTNYHSSCHAYTIGLEANQIWNTPLTGKYTLRSPKNYMHALCQ